MGQKYFWNTFRGITNKSKHSSIPPIVDKLST